MTLTPFGYDNADITVEGFQKICWLIADGGHRHVVRYGLTVSPGAGTRQVSISVGQAASPGVVVDNDAIATLTLAANATGDVRTDYIVLRNNSTTGASTFAIVEGTSPAVPSLLQQIGTTWEIPLATVAVPNGHATTFSASHITARKPIPRQSYFYTDDLATSSIAYNNSGTVIASVDIPDPGWRYRVRVTASCQFASTASGYGRIRALVDGVNVGNGVTPRLNLGGDMPAHLDAVSGYLTKPATVQLVATPLSMSSGSSLNVTSSMQSFWVELIPAFN